MTKKEAIGWLEKDIKLHEVFNETKHQNKVLEALEMAIKALEQEPKRGEWVQAKEVEIEYAVCTNCTHHGEFYMRYCPNCGAYMR